MAKFAGEIVGAVEIGVGVVLAANGIPFGATLFKLGLATELASVASLLLAPKTKAQQAQATEVQLGEVPRSGLFGIGATAGSLVDACEVQA